MSQTISEFSCLPNPRGHRHLVQVGLLTSGACFLCPFPIHLTSGLFRDVFFSGYSGGPVPEFHRIPFWLFSLKQPLCFHAHLDNFFVFLYLMRNTCQTDNSFHNDIENSSKFISGVGPIDKHPGPTWCPRLIIGINLLLLCTLTL